MRLRATPRSVLISVLVLVLGLGTAWVARQGPLSSPVTSAEIESVGILAVQARQPQALAQLEAWAQSGLVVAQRELGLAEALNSDRWLQACQWLQKAADAGDREAQFELANAYLYAKLGLPKNDPQAWIYYEKAASQGDDKASFMLARMAGHGWGVTQSATLSAHWLTLSSHLGNPQAMYELSVAYAQGDGVPQDQAQARYWLEQSADHDYKIAMQALALELEAQGRQDARASERSKVLLKEASDHRLMHWNTSL
jgi:uncharacterized protein